MRDRGIADPKEAFTLLHDELAYTTVGPNSGFMDQLALWSDMGYKLDPGSHGYRRWKLWLMAMQFQDFGYVSELSVSSVGEISSRDGVPTRRFKCKKCRTVLVDQDHVLQHEPGMFSNWYFANGTL